MNKLQQVIASLIAGTSILAASAATAAPIVYFGENQTPASTVTGTPVDARNSFLAGLEGVSTVNFESYANGANSPLALDFTGSTGTITATLSGNGEVTSDTDAGRFNTSAGGSKYWEVSGDFTITFCLNLANGCLAGSAVGLCFYNIVFDPDWTTERGVCGDCEAGGAGNGGNGSTGGRVVRVRRPIMGYKCLEKRVETEDEVWEDGFRYEQAMFRV